MSAYIRPPIVKDLDAQMYALEIALIAVGQLPEGEYAKVRKGLQDCREMVRALKILTPIFQGKQR